MWKQPAKKSRSRRNQAQAWAIQLVKADCLKAINEAIHGQTGVVRFSKESLALAHKNLRERKVHRPSATGAADRDILRLAQRATFEQKVLSELLAIKKVFGIGPRRRAR